MGIRKRHDSHERTIRAHISDVPAAMAFDGPGTVKDKMVLSE